jgi:hypothetical protein
MRRIVATVLLLSGFNLAIASELANSVKPFTYQYSMLRNNAKLGVAEMTFKPISANTWQFTSESKGTEGLAQVARASASDTSVLALKNGQFELKYNRVETKVAFSTRIKTTQLSSDGKTYQYKDRKGDKFVAYKSGAWDQHSLTIALMGELLKQKKSPFVFQVVNRNKIEPYTFKIISTQVLDTAIGKLNTVRVDRIRNDGVDKKTQIWFAIDKNYAPVLVQQSNEDGDAIEMRILSLN